MSMARVLPIAPAAVPTLHEATASPAGGKRGDAV
jgi:hypothetical protein